MKTAEEWAASSDVKDGCWRGDHATGTAQGCSCGDGPCEDFLPVIRAAMAEARAAGREEMRKDVIEGLDASFIAVPFDHGDPWDDGYDCARTAAYDVVCALKEGGHNENG